MYDHLKTPAGFIRVDKPDHPFTFDGPDILLSSTKGLIAIFQVRPGEYRSEGKLISRITYSLIAYPAETQMLLLLNNKNDDQFSKFGRDFFDKIVEPKDIAKSNLIVKEKKPDRSIKSIKQTQKNLFKTQAQIQNNNLIYISKTKFESKNMGSYAKFAKKASYYDRVKEKIVFPKANIYDNGEFIFGSKTLRSSGSDIIGLQPFYNFSLGHDFQVDKAVPYFKYSHGKVLNLNAVPKNRFDPIKPIRIASLMGWYLANTDSIDDLELRIPKHLRNK